MDISILHFHVLIVTLFLAFYFFKFIVLMLNKLDLLNRIRGKTKKLEMIIGSLILITGAYLWILLGTTESYILVKMVVMLVAVPLGITGMKNNRKGISLISLLLLIYIYGIAESKSYKFKKDPVVVDAGADRGNSVYVQKCIQCHGESGDKGLFKAPDLGASSLSFEEKVNNIKNGKGAMRAYARELTEDDIKAVAKYVDEIGKE